MKKNLITSVEITDSHIKILQAVLTRFGPTLTFCDLREISNFSDDNIAETIAKTIIQAKIKTGNLIAVVPRRFAIFRHASLPSHTTQEIEKMINLQVITQIPYPKEDVVLDYGIASKDPSGYSKVLVIAVHKQVVELYMRIFNTTGLHLNKLTLSSAGLLNWYIFQQEKVARKDNKPVALINIDTLNTEICFCQDKKLLFSRGINFGARDLNPENIVTFIEEIGLTMSTYTKETMGEEVSRILLISAAGEVALLKERLAGEYKAAIEIANALDGIPQKKGLVPPVLIHRHGVSVTATLGLACVDSQKLINLLPADVSDTRQINQRKKEYVSLLVILAMTFLLIISAFGVKTYKSSWYLSHLQKAINDSELKVQSVKEKIERLQFLKSKLEPGISDIDIIRELYNLVPTDVSFSLLHLDQGRTLTLQGVSESGTSVNSFQKNLANSPLFKNVTLQYATKRKIFKGELTDFKITCQVAQK